MKYFFQDYLAMPLSILLFLLIAPTVMLGGVILALTLVDLTPVCEVRK
jgi:hypothetical protein